MAFQVPAGGSPNWQDMDRDIDRGLANAPIMEDFTVATLPNALTYGRKWIVVTDEVGGEVPAFPDSSGQWRRSTDRAIVS